MARNLPQQYKNQMYTSSFKLDIEILRKFDKICVEKGVSRTSVLKTMIEKYLKNHEKNSKGS